MRVMVLYCSYYGSTKGIAERIADTLRDRNLEVALRSVDGDFAGLPFEMFDGFVIGSSVHASHWVRPAIEFVRRNAIQLATRPSWLFSSGPIGDKYEDQPQPDPKEIAEIRRLLDVRDHVVFAGSFDPETADMSRAGWFERQISTHFLPVGDFRDWREIESWAMGVAGDLDARSWPYRQPIGVQPEPALSK